MSEFDELRSLPRELLYAEAAYRLAPTLGNTSRLGRVWQPSEAVLAVDAQR